MSDGNEMLKQNLEAQLQRLILQLNDLEDCKNEMTDAEYTESKEDTIEQLKEFEERLNKITTGNKLLYDKFNIMRLATSSVITRACKEPLIYDLLTQKAKIDEYKDQLNKIEREMRLGKLTLDDGKIQKMKVLTELRLYGYQLTECQYTFLEEETRKLQDSTLANSFDVPEYINGFDFNVFLEN